tara:strand:- start:18938 stop:19948 length:1011 start_codon:yes stop_codon:yes gene_type:complete
MGKFLDKKEQVFDFKLTNYGNYLLAIGKLKPVYYTFIDDNIVYDSAYFGRTAEPQSEIHQRIKQETPYLESLVLFEQVNQNTPTDLDIDFFGLDVTPTEKIPNIDEFRLNNIIGDAFVPESKEKAPSWKLVSLNRDIDSSTEIDLNNQTRIPQINISASYKKQIVDSQEFVNQNVSADDARILEAVSAAFVDNKVVRLQLESDVLLYLEELNTEVLNENFELEVFLVQDSSDTSEQKLIRKYFQNKEEQIVDGLMIAPNPLGVQSSEQSKDSVEQFFSVLTDSEIDSQVACKAASEFNKESYLIDIDFNCNETQQEDLFFDIYGSETEEDVEICQT